MIYHITPYAEWKDAEANGTYSAPSLETEGFIHCSTRDQILKVANAFYRGEADLVILCIDDDALAPSIQWEAPVHPNPDDAPDTDDAELFPHVYGAIGVHAVEAVVRFPEGADGFAMPADLPS